MGAGKQKPIHEIIGAGFVIIDGKKIPVLSLSDVVTNVEPKPMPYKITQKWAPAIMLPGTLCCGPRRVSLPGVPIIDRLNELILMHLECFERTLVSIARRNKMHVPPCRDVPYGGTWG